MYLLYRKMTINGTCSEINGHFSVYSLNFVFAIIMHFAMNTLSLDPNQSTKRPCYR